MIIECFGEARISITWTIIGEIKKILPVLLITAMLDVVAGDFLQTILVSTL